MQRAVWKIGIPLLLFGLLVLGFSVSGAFAASPLLVSYNPTPVVVQNNSSSSSTTSTTSGTTTTQSGGTTTTGTTGATGTTTTGTTTTTPSSSAVVVNSTASPLPVSCAPTPVVYTTPTTTSTTTTGTTGTTTTGTTTTTPSSSAVVVNSSASPLPVSCAPAPVVYNTPTTTPTTTTGAAGTTGATTTTVTPTPVDTTGLTADEATLVDLINEDRADYGLSAVTVNLTATEAATAKAQDMITNDYFSDESPTYGLPSQLLTDFGVSFTVCGENIAEVANVEVANSDFMSDPSHEAIILDPSFTQVGVGVVPTDDGYEVIVEEFIG